MFSLNIYFFFSQLPVNGYVVKGNMDNNTWAAGEIIELKCRYGYLIAGKKNAECLSNGTWSAIPNCERELNSSIVI